MNLKGADTCVECVWHPDGHVKPYVSYNDGTHNYQFFVGSQFIIEASGKNSSVGGVEDGQLYCRFKRKYDVPQEAIKPMSSVYPPTEVPFMIFPLNGSYMLQFAKGHADPRSKNSLILTGFSDIN